MAADAAGLGVWNWNFAENSLEWDDRMYEIYDVPQAARKRELGYATWRSSLHPDDLEIAETAIQEAVRAGAPWQMIFRIVRPDGEVRYIQTSGVVDYDRHGTPLRMIGINRDVTEQIAYQQSLEETNAWLERNVAERTVDLRNAVAALERANAGKDAFMAAVSHELRTPLTGILGLAETPEMQVRGPLNERQLHFVEAIKQSGERLLEMVNSILNYTQVAAGQRHQVHA